MKKSVRDTLESKWADIQRFLTVGEFSGVVRRLALVEILLASLPEPERPLWRERLASIHLSSIALDQVLAKGQAEISYARRLIEDAPKLIDDEIMLLLSKVDDLLLIERYVCRFRPVAWAEELRDLRSEIAQLRTSTVIGRAIKRCESIIRKNTLVYLV